MADSNQRHTAFGSHFAAHAASPSQPHFMRPPSQQRTSKSPLQTPVQSLAGPGSPTLPGPALHSPLQLMCSFPPSQTGGFAFTSQAPQVIEQASKHALQSSPASAVAHEVPELDAPDEDDDEDELDDDADAPPSVLPSSVLSEEQARITANEARPMTRAGRIMAEYYAPRRRAMREFAYPDRWSLSRCASDAPARGEPRRG